MAIKAERIAEEFGASLFDANLALLIIRGRFTDEKFPSVFQRRFPQTQAWLNACFHKPRPREIALEMLNELFDTCGVEAIEHETIYVDSYYRNIVASYLNTGDTYAPTLLLDHIDNRWRLTSWGDFVESLDARFDEQEEDE
jgi:hypothetical protein